MTSEGVPRVDGAEPPWWRGGEGPPVVVVHGGPGIGHDYLRQPPTRPLDAHHEPVFYDQRSGGRSTGRVESLSLDRFTRDLERLVVDLRPEPPVLLGHSFGGLVVMEAAARARSRRARGGNPVS